MQGLALWTIPELRVWMDRRGIACPRTATKSQLKTKIAIWVRDQVATTVPEKEKVQDVVDEEEPRKTDLEAATQDEDLDSESSDDDEIDDDSSTSSSSSSSDDEELEILGAPTKKDLVDTDEGDRESMHADTDAVEISVSLAKSNKDVNPRCPLKAALKSLFGYSTFRQGQEWAIRRCLDNKRTLLVAPTGFGKSMCYAIPAALKEGVCIVVSPLLSLIQVRTRCLPGFSMLSAFSPLQNDAFRTNFGCFHLVLLPPRSLVLSQQRQWLPLWTTFFGAESRLSSFHQRG